MKIHQDEAYLVLLVREREREREKKKMSSLQVITCRGVVCWGAEEEWKVEEIQVDPPKGSEVRLQMLFASVCHTDILCSRGFPIPLYPRVLGHEGVGIVESVGEEVKALKKGDVVIPAFVGECGECENCNSDMTNLCLRHPLSFSGVLPDGTSRMSIRGQTLYHLLSCSTWSEYTVSDANYVVKVDPDVALPHASFLSCGFSTGFGAAWVDSKVESGSSVAVIGLGAVGLGAMEGARVQGATTIIGVDKNGMKRDKGEAFGMTHFINPDDQRSSDNADSKSISEMVKELTGGVGVDHCFECTGVPDLINQALEATKVGKGKAVVVGAGLEPFVQISFLNLLMGRTLKGTIFGGLKCQTHLPLLIHKAKTKEIQLDELLTHEIKLEDVPKTLEILRQPNCVKILIKI